ncbi:reticulocyte binding protein 2b (RBP2b) [Plasmodium ovale wallikeri]|uniref:Reticulocyte binding protein 2b (RBP2b) n=1 Tax=Plasmodium ovale wallikeri TaxID=864142 RepID=A0A1A9AH65_PLAOA|nr:reticulocyte binding protein 2b (RBP2b) [Plasmodium ovale wallikeri]
MKKEIEEINNAFESAYAKIHGKRKEASGISINYDKVKELRENSQKEEKILHNKEEETKKYLDDKLAEDIKKLSDENDSSDILEQAVEQNSEIQNTVVNILTGLQMSDLNIQARSKETEEIKFDQNTVKIIENKNESKNIIELDVYNIMQNSYISVLHIYKYSNEIEAKIEECDNLTHTGKGVFRRITFINKSKRKMNTTKSRNSSLSVNIREAFNKSKNLNNIKCSADNNHNILEISQHEKLRALSNSFIQKTSNKENEAKLTELKTSFDQNTSLGNLEKEIENVSAENDNSEDIEKKILTIDEILKEVERLDFEIKNIDSLFNELLKNGKEREVFTYTPAKDSLNSKITHGLEIINKKKTLAQEYLAYVRNRYVSINTINELEEKIKEIKDEFTAINEKSEINDLQYSVEKLKILYNTLNNKKNRMGVIYIKINLIKLKEIKHSSSKFNDTTEVFNSVVTTKKEGVLKNKNNIDAVMQSLKRKEIELDNADSSFIMESINEFDKINNDVMTNIWELQELEGYNKSENKKVKVYLDKYSHLIERNKNLITDVNKFAMNGELIKEYKDISNDINGNIPKAKNEINNLGEKLNSLLENTKENEKLYFNNDTDDFISSILKKLKDIKAKISKNLPVSEKLFNTKNNLEYIRDNFNRIKNVDDEIKRSAGLKYIQEIKNIVSNITKYSEQTKGKLYKKKKKKNELDRIKIKKKEMDDLFKTISTKNRNAYDSANFFVSDSNKIIEELENYDEKMTDIINKVEKERSDLEGEIEKVQHELEEQKRELEQQRKNQLKQQESSEINKHVTEDSSAHEHNLLSSSQEIPQSTWNDSHLEESQNNHHLNATYADEKTRLARGIIIVVSIFSFVDLAIFMKKEEEKKEFKVLDEEFEYSKKF